MGPAEASAELAVHRERFRLAETLLRMWAFPYPTKHVRFAAHLIAARLACGIPSPLE